MVWWVVLSIVAGALGLLTLGFWWEWRKPWFDEDEGLLVFGSEEEQESFDRVFRRVLRHERGYLDCHYILKVFGREQMRDYFGAEFDDAGDVVALNESEPELTGFITDFDEVIVAAMTDPGRLRRHLGMSDPAYDRDYEGDLYVMVFDLNSYAYEMDGNWHAYIRDIDEVLPGFEDSGEVPGGSREMEIPRSISVKDRILWVERVSAEGRHPPFTVRRS